MAYKVLNNVSVKDAGSNSLASLKTDMLVIVINKNTMSDSSFKELNKISKNYISKTISSHLKDSSSNVLLPKIDGIAAANILLANGLDSSAPTHKWLSMYQSIAHKGNSLKCKDISIMPGSISPAKKDEFWLIETVAKTIESSVYIFSETKNKTATKPAVKKLTILTSGLSGSNLTKAKHAAKTGYAIGEGVNTAKYLGDLPANHCTPRIIEKKVKGMTKDFPNLKVKSFNEQQMQKMGMGSFLSVSRGSEEPARMMVIEYKGGKANEKPIALVGKGVTFDTGGVSIKPSPAMDEMKWDMCGAATVFGVMSTLARLNANVNVVGVMGCAENMCSSKATKPGDVVTSMSGQTIEILNTDAEGRLILADCLTFVGKYKPSYVIDMATLTGAVVVALGRHASGVMTNDQHLAEKIIEAGEESGDRAWQLPLWDEHQSCTKTKYADLANIGGGREAGTIHAAAFLSKFTNDYKWAHIDIAATASYSSPVKAGTGRPVPLISQLLLSKKLK
ncbi:leucyl aminopeptidase [Gammaproteobacteria bacterium]|nr:leucyl aminopeptidase [Gammaproteobacteria bacterium]MDB4848748.1 leucyl aminopeptidase [Gammaproteobacteria bacterium]MDC0401441.1 leucyl aminopeptidase [Gammaproteobacteria bacterium]MDC1074093.1 leucyl aminopeptidase [Gammaproteobacteria bacterium]MDC6460303.1 leucyl aminopeptidase [Gammaproteobacteria bacterium]